MSEHWSKLAARVKEAIEAERPAWPKRSNARRSWPLVRR